MRGTWRTLAALALSMTVSGCQGACTSARLAPIPDELMQSLSPSEGAAVIPILTAITLGLFPTWAEETWGLRFSLERAGAPEDAVVIDFRWKGYTVLGWPSALLNLSPNRAGTNPAEGPRYAAHVAATIAPYATEIEALASAR